MIILHAAVLEGRLWIWAETSLELVMVSRRGRKPHRVAEAFPYDVGQKGLETLLTQILRVRKIDSVPQTPISHSKSQIPQEKAQEMIVWLPTVGKQPVVSSPLIAPLPGADGELRLAPWSVTAVAPPPSLTLDFLCACVDRELLGPGMLVGPDLAFWSTAMRFAATLVARQQFLPGVRRAGEGYCASWGPVLSKSDSDHLQLLAKTMPAVCRALSQNNEQAPAQTSARVALQSFLEIMVDALVRQGSPAAAPLLASKSRQRSPVFDSVHDQWLSALRSPTGTMDGAELSQLAEQIGQWQGPITLATATPFRLCFRLEEPVEEGEEAGEEGKQDRQRPSAAKTWYVRYLLQAVDDPSLLVPAAEAWKRSGQQKVSILKRRGFKPREYLLAALGQAAALSPAIQESLKDQAPEGSPLAVTGAYEFLTQTAWVLEEMGFCVLLPAWWTRKGAKRRLAIHAEVKSPQLKAPGMLSLETILDLQWEVALGDEILSWKELEALARLKVPLVRVRGQWVQVSAEEIQSVLEFWKKKGAERVTVGQLVKMKLQQSTIDGKLPVEEVKTSGWLKDFLDQLQGNANWEELPSPSGLQGTLRPYQLRGYSWLSFLRRWGLGACLADDMGLGKTVQTLALIQREWEAGCRQPVLLICPTSVTGNWQKEAARFTPNLPVMVHHGMKRLKGTTFAKEAQRNAVVISSYSLLYRDVELLQQVNWAGVVLDEAQNIKNPETRQAQSARAIQADYRLALTGTPVENTVSDLWSIMEFLNPGFLGNQRQFKETFFIPIQAYRDAEATQRLKQTVGPFVLRRLKTDKTIIQDLPEKMEMKVFCTLTREQASLYEAVAQEALQILETADGMQRRGVILASLSKLKQVCNHPAQFLGDHSSLAARSGKLNRLTEMVEEILSVGDRTLIFSQFAEMGKILQRHLQESFGHEVLFLHGSVPKKERDQIVERFQNAENGPQLFVLSLKAGGTGLNLTRANHVFHFDRWWNPAVENQASDRAYRIGQTKDVQVHKFLCMGTLEERIDEMIEQKKEIAAHIVGTGEGWLTELSTTELKELMSLRWESVGDK